MIMIAKNNDNDSFCDDQYLLNWLNRLNNISNIVKIYIGEEKFKRDFLYSWDKITKYKGINRFMILHEDNDLYVLLNDDCDGR